MDFCATFEGLQIHIEDQGFHLGFYRRRDSRYRKCLLWRHRIKGLGFQMTPMATGLHVAQRTFL